jgi:hypothetical protein
MAQQVYASVLPAVEQARIEEARDTPVFAVLDLPDVPARLAETIREGCAESVARRYPWRYDRGVRRFTDTAHYRFDDERRVGSRKRIDSSSSRH